MVYLTMFLYPSQLYAFLVPLGALKLMSLFIFYKEWKETGVYHVKILEHISEYLIYICRGEITKFILGSCKIFLLLT